MRTRTVRIRRLLLQDRRREHTGEQQALWRFASMNWSRSGTNSRCFLSYAESSEAYLMSVVLMCQSQCAPPVGDSNSGDAPLCHRKAVNAQQAVFAAHIFRAQHSQPVQNLGYSFKLCKDCDKKVIALDLDTLPCILSKFYANSVAATELNNTYSLLSCLPHLLISGQT